MKRVFIYCLTVCLLVGMLVVMGCQYTSREGCHGCLTGCFSTGCRLCGDSVRQCQDEMPTAEVIYELPEKKGCRTGYSQLNDPEDYSNFSYEILSVDGSLVRLSFRVELHKDVDVAYLRLDVFDFSGNQQARAYVKGNKEVFNGSTQTVTIRINSYIIGEKGVTVSASMFA